jgi:prevent-host-death family protein
METRHVDAVEARKGFAEVIERVARGEERVVVRRDGEEIVAVIPMEDLKLLDRLIEEEEDRIDAEEARKVLTDPTDEAVPWEEVKKELGL